MMDMEVKHFAVHKNITIEAPVEHVFRAFTAGLNDWWPRTHHIGGCERFTAVVEAREGGRWFERGDDGSECDWGHVLVWEEPTRIILSWDVSAQWSYDPDLNTEVEVRFIAESPRRTRVELEHRCLERYGDKAEAMRALYDSPDAWLGGLALLRVYAEAAPR